MPSAFNFPRRYCRRVSRSRCSIRQHEGRFVKHVPTAPLLERTEFGRPGNGAEHISTGPSLAFGRLTPGSRPFHSVPYPSHSHVIRSPGRAHLSALNGERFWTNLNTGWQPKLSLPFLRPVILAVSEHETPLLERAAWSSSRTGLFQTTSQLRQARDTCLLLANGLDKTSSVRNELS